MTSPTVFHNGLLIDGKGGPPRPHSSVLVSNGRIRMIFDATDYLPQDVQVVECEGRAIMPGLIDMHCHLEDAHLMQLLRSGVTTVRDVGNELDRVRHFAEVSAANPCAGPTVIYAGELLDGDPPTWPAMSRVVMDEMTAADEVRKLCTAGAGVIKTYMSIPGPAMSAVVRTAHDFGVPVTSHLGDVDALMAAAMGVDGLEHAAQSLYSCVVPKELVQPAADRRRLGQARFWARFVAGWAAVSPSGDRVQRVVDALVDAGVSLDATLGVVEEMLLDPALRAPVDAGLEGFVDPARQAEWTRLIEWFTGGWARQQYEDAARAVINVREVVQVFHLAGGSVVAGTDAPFPYLVPGQALHDELSRLNGAGLSPIEAIHAATGGAAAALRLSDEVGTIEPGRRADLLVIDGDPSRWLKDSRKIDAVYREGTLCAGGSAPRLV